MTTPERMKPFFQPYTDDQAAAIRECLDEWYFRPRDLDISDPAVYEREGDPHILTRYRFTCNRWVPWISRFADINKDTTNVVEIGSGTGSLISAFGHVAAEVHGFDIDYNSTMAARGRAEALGQTNVHAHCHPPEEISDRIRSDSPDSVDIVSLYATLEHQTYQERQNTLQVAWDVLRPGGVLVIGQTPNLLTYYHPHTSRTSFFDMMPDDVKWMYLDRMDKTRFVERMTNWRDTGSDNLEMALTRWGRGVSYHDFEIALGDLAPLIVGTGFEEEILQFNPVELEERLLLTYLAKREPTIPIAFARRWLTLVLRKPDPATPTPALQHDPEFVAGLIFSDD